MALHRKSKVWRDKSGAREAGASKSLGWSVADPRNRRLKITTARGAATALIAEALAASAGLARILDLNLGFRCAPPSFYACRPLTGCALRSLPRSVPCSLTLNFLCKRQQRSQNLRDCSNLEERQVLLSQFKLGVTPPYFNTCARTILGDIRIWHRNFQSSVISVSNALREQFHLTSLKVSPSATTDSCPPPLVSRCR